MTKREYCLNHKAVAVYTLCNTAGILIKGIEYGIEDIVYSEFHAGERVTYHKSKVYYTDDGSYFMIGRIKIPLHECMKVG